MSSAAEILVVIVSIVLALFLVIAIVLFIYLLRLTAEIRKVAVSAQKTVDHIEKTVSQVNNIVTPLSIARIVKQNLNLFRSKGETHGKKAKRS